MNSYTHTHHGRRALGAMALALALLLALAGPASARSLAASDATYTNPLNIAIPGDGRVESCADPTVIRGQQPGDNAWYMYCTKDPLNDQDRDAGGFHFHNIPMLKSLDLVNWTYVGDAFSMVPSWGEPTSGMWAPEVQFFDDQYYLYYTMTDLKTEVSGEPDCGFEPAIGVATSASPTGPWQDLGRPVVAPRRGGPGCNFLWTFDPDVITAGGQRYIYYGSYYGGIQVRLLSEDGFTTDPATAVQVTIPNRYEGAEVEAHDGYFYLFVSAGNCCNGPVTGYSVFAGRSTSPTGPFVDRDGVSLLAGRVGGTPVIRQNGNRWVGTGHNSVFQDLQGQYWTAYHAVDRNNPYFAGTTDFTKRPVLLDRLDWIDGWPALNAGNGPSDGPRTAPSAQPGDKNKSKDKPPRQLKLGKPISALSDEFDGATLSAQWSWVRPPDPSTYGLTGAAFRFDTQAADLYQDNNSASVLTEPAPSGDYVVEARVKLNLPAEGCCFNYVQAGLLIYGDDDNYVRLMHVSIWETRQTEFGKEFVEPGRGPHFGSTLVGPPGETTWLRILKRTVGGEEQYTAYTSRDGETWVRGGTWTHQLGASARIGLASMGGSGFVAEFDYVRVYEYKEGLDA